MKRREFLHKVAGITMSAFIADTTFNSEAFSKTENKKPNIIICTCDQLRSFAVGCYGNKQTKTPNIDKLAENGIMFQTAVTNNPACSPARSTLISGQYSRTSTGSVFNCGEPTEKRNAFTKKTLPEILKNHGYKTALIGKWHIKTKPENLGFDTALYPNVQHSYMGQTFHNEKDESFEVSEFSVQYEIEHVRKFLREKRQNQKPFFLYYNISPPHHPIGPRHMPKKCTRMFDPEKIKLRPNTNIDTDKPFDRGGWFEAINTKGETPETWNQYYRFWFNTYYNSDFFNSWYHGKPSKNSEPVPQDFDLKDLTALYYGATACVDDMVGQLMNSLEQNGLDENTIVVFVSDHGDNLGSHGQFNKNILLEESIRVPMIFYCPEKLKPRNSKKQIAQIIDIPKTLLTLSGINAPDYMQGNDLKPILTGQTDRLEENHVFIETDALQIGIRTSRYLYGMQIDFETKKITNDALYFFDLKQDPYQQNNLAGTEKKKNTAEKLRRKLITWHKNTPWME